MTVKKPDPKTTQQPTSRTSPVRQAITFKLVQTHAMNAWQNDLNFRSLVEADPAITAKLSPQKLAAAFDYHRQLTNIDEVFTRVLAAD